jgi:ubiquinone/menaquinone biosynthesis C-methylase UbiE
MNAANGVTLAAAATAFDRVAESYDELFTHTAIGRAQRKQVWKKLLAAFPRGSRILELNCGTGEDARFLAREGRSVMACDASAAMMAVARRRDEGADDVSTIQYLQTANEDLGVLRLEEPFDGAFSNFSGLNCLADFPSFACNLAKLVKPGGRVLVCVWSRVCMGELVWYLLHAEPKKAVRRFSSTTSARLGELRIFVAYPTVREMRYSFSPWFQLMSRRAVGLFVPPSYAERAIARHKKILACLEWLDSLCAGWPILRDVGDHVLLEFVRCNP